MSSKKQIPPAPAFPSLRSAWLHLQKAGFKISNGKIYKDKASGAIPVQADGSVLESDIRDYAATLERKTANIDNLNDVQVRKAEKDVTFKDIKIKKMQFEYDRLKGKYIPRSDFEAEMAARAGIFDSGFRLLFNRKAREWIALCGGKVEKTAEFISALNQALDEQLTNYATLSVFQVLFTDKKEKEE